MNNRDIDVAIAKKVMGWKKGELNWTIDELWIDSKGSYKYVGKFSPSTNISDAWQVVEKMRKEGFVAHINVHPNRYTCEIYKNIEGYYNFICKQEAETAPLAICLSALRAKGIDIDGSN